LRVVFFAKNIKTFNYLIFSVFKKCTTPVIGGILLIAIADALSDALGIHIAEESDNRHSVREIWEATVATFLSKFIFSLTFIIPILLFQISTAIIVSIVYGLTLLIILNYYVAKKQKIKPLGVIMEHLFIAIVVIVITHLIGEWVSGFA
jgi:vacuolar iron transporter family protein